MVKMKLIIIIIVMFGSQLGICEDVDCMIYLYKRDGRDLVPLQQDINEIIIRENNSYSNTSGSSITLRRKSDILVRANSRGANVRTHRIPLTLQSGTAYSIKPGAEYEESVFCIPAKINLGRFNGTVNSYRVNVEVLPQNKKIIDIYFSLPHEEIKSNDDWFGIYYRDHNTLSNEVVQPRLFALSESSTITLNNAGHNGTVLIFRQLDNGVYKAVLSFCVTADVDNAESSPFLARISKLRKYDEGGSSLLLKYPVKHAWQESGISRRMYLKGIEDGCIYAFMILPFARYHRHDGQDRSGVVSFQVPAGKYEIIWQDGNRRELFSKHIDINSGKETIEVELEK